MPGLAHAELASTSVQVGWQTAPVPPEHALATRGVQLAAPSTGPSGVASGFGAPREAEQPAPHIAARMPTAKSRESNTVRYLSGPPQICLGTTAGLQVHQALSRDLLPASLTCGAIRGSNDTSTVP